MTLPVEFSDIIEGIRRETLGVRDPDRRRDAGRLLLAVARECLPAGAAREVLQDALLARLAAG